MEQRDDLFIWNAFAAEAPTVAAAGRELFDRFGFVFVGTVRADGCPRISAVESTWWTDTSSS